MKISHIGDGQRVCIGKGFAMMEATLILATIVQKFKLELLSEPPIVPFPSMTLRPKYGIKVLVKDR
ncbi:MAG: cytochrome P450 [Xenococcaceae cyanobacterium MO_167.B27]|nr:cytochrome P450 [Xenococcaceae cyanobacterium MO_167.B27]